MSILILVCLINLTLIELDRHRRGIRDAFAMAFVGIFATVVVTTEVFSLFNAITFPALSVLWATLAAVSSVLTWRYSDRNVMRTVIPAMRAQIRNGDPESRLSLVSIACILAITLAVALRAPPNTWDSMTYHMARVAAWIQHGNIEFFPTAITRQNYQPPLGGFAILHLQLLSGSDLFANLPQWLCFVACIVLTSLVVKEFRQLLSVQIFAGLVMATLPSAILQASSTQTDLVCGVFCLASAFFVLRLAHNPCPSNIIYSGLSVGLALLAKGTAYLYISAIGLTLGVLCLAQFRLRPRFTTIGTLAGMALLVVAMNIGHWSRTYALYGRPLSGGTESYINEECGVTAVWANLVRNTGLHLGTLIPVVDDTTTAAIAAVLGKEGSNPKTTWNRRRLCVEFSTHEDRAGNILHLTLIVASLALLCLGRVRDVDRGALAVWASSIIVGALFFCGCLKWQSWNARLHLPLFIVAMPLVALTVAAYGRTRPVLMLAVTCLLSVSSVPFLLSNTTRPLIPQDGFSIVNHTRMEITLHTYSAAVNTYPDAVSAYPDAVRAALSEHPHEIGLMLNNDDWEYPLWVLSGKSAHLQLPTFHHVMVENDTQALDSTQSLPAVIISTRSLTPSAVAELGYECIYENGGVRVLKRQQPMPAEYNRGRG